MTQSTPVPEAVIEAAYSGEPLDNRPPEAMDGRTVQYIYSYGYSTGRSHAAEAVRRAALTSPPKAEAGDIDPVERALWRANLQAHGAAQRMVREAIEELFGPVASLESEDAVLLRGPEPHHTAEAFIAALQRVKSALSPTPEPRGDVREEDGGLDAGINYAIGQLCEVLDVDPRSISWDAATETMDGDVSSVICNVLRAAYGEEWSSKPEDTARIRAALNPGATNAR